MHMEMCVHPQCGESMSSHRNRLRAKVRLRSDVAVAPLEPAFFDAKEARPQFEAGFFVSAFPCAQAVTRSTQRPVVEAPTPATPGDASNEGFNRGGKRPSCTGAAHGSA